MSKKIVIIGGGIIGLCTAYYLQKEGHEVTIIEQSNMDGGASYVNAGYLSPSHIIPLSAPGVMKKGLKWMFDATSPLYIKPQFDLDFLKWVWAFNKSCTSKNVKKAIPAIKNIAVLSQELYDDIKKDENFTFHYEKKGLLMLCKTNKMLESEIKIAQLAKNEGLEGEEISLDTLKKLEPNVKFNVKGAVYYQNDSHTTPHEFMDEMKTYLKTVGVKLYKNEKVIDLTILSDKALKVITDKKEIFTDELVVAAGSWSPLLSKKLGVKLLVQAGKGYRINTLQETSITIPAIFVEAKAAVTPMNGFTRFAGTMEIAGINHTINKTRVEAIANSVTDYYPEIKLTQEEKNGAAAGLRPVSPDGLPYIGRPNKHKNITIATGHAMMGWSMATATGKLVSEIISDKKSTIDIAPFYPDRKF